MGDTLFGGRALLAVVAIVAGAVVAGVVGPGTAYAHNSLASSDPKNGARVARPPAAVKLTFLSRLDPKTTTVTVAGPDGGSAASGAPAFAGRTVTVRLRPGAAGAYTVAYQLVSSDGHPIKGRVRFTAATGNAPVVAAPSASAPAPPTGSPSATASPSLAPASRQGTDGTGFAGWIILGVLILIALSLFVLLVRRRRGAEQSLYGELQR